MLTREMENLSLNEQPYPGLNVKQRKPYLNAEPMPADLVQHFITPDELAFRRNHTAILNQSEDQFISVEIAPSLLPQIIDELKGRSNGLNRSRLEALLKQTIQIPIKELQDDKWEKTEVVATLQCAGNRRDEMSAMKEKCEGLGWGNGVISNCQWKGVPIRSILEYLGLTTLSSLSNTHLVFRNSHPSQDDPTGYESSLPMSVSVDPERPVLLGTHVNGQKLLHDRGGPIRVVVPGYIGARWVKWLEKIIISDKESVNYYMTLDYKVLPEEATSETKKEWMAKLPPLTHYGLNSVICSPCDGSEVNINPEDETVLVQGYAATGSGCPITKVQVAVLDESCCLKAKQPKEGEEGWINAAIEGEGKWAWRLWNVRIPVGNYKEQKVAFVSRAEEACGVKQPTNSPWNVRGVENRSWSVVKDIIIRPSTPN